MRSDPKIEITATGSEGAAIYHKHIQLPGLPFDICLGEHIEPHPPELFGNLERVAEHCTMRAGVIARTIAKAMNN